MSTTVDQATRDRIFALAAILQAKTPAGRMLAADDALEGRHITREEYFALLDAPSPDGAAAPAADKADSMGDAPEPGGDLWARAHRVWARLGGLGPMVGHDLRPDVIVSEIADEQPDALAYARSAALAQRFALRVRLIKAALPGAMQTTNVSRPELVASTAVRCADAVLAALDAEAKGGAT